MTAGFRVLRASSLVVAAAAFLSPGLLLGPSADAAVYVLAGVRIREGFMPYRDLVDNKPPGTYLANAIGQAVAPWADPWSVAWALSVVACGTSVVIMDALLRRSIGPRAAWVWSLIYAAGVAGYLTAFGGGLTETYALLPLTLALWLVVTRRPRARVGLAIGGLLGLACLLSLECVPAAVVLALAYSYSGHNLMEFASRLAAQVATAGLLALAVVAWLLETGAAAAAFDQIVPYNQAYRDSGSGPLAVLPVALVFFGGLAIPMAMAVRRMVAEPSISDRLGWASLAWIVAYGAYVAYQNRGFPHYLMLAVAPVTVLSARGLAPLWSSLEARSRTLRQALVAVILALLFSMSVTLSIGLGAIAVENDRRVNDSSAAAAAWIRDNQPSRATMFVWGYDPYLYLETDTLQSDAYVYLFPLITPGYGSADRTAAVLERWRTDPPRLIVESDSPVPLNRPKSAGGDSRELDTLGPLRDFVRAHYRLAASFGETAAFDDVYVFVG